MEANPEMVTLDSVKGVVACQRWRMERGDRGRGGDPSCMTVRGFWWEKLTESGGERKSSCLAAIYKTVIWESVSGRQKQGGVAD